MSVIDILLGAAGGLGGGMMREADINERNAMTQAQMDERARRDREMQQLRNDSRDYATDTKLQIAELKAAAGAGGGGKGPLFNLAQAAMNASTPDEQEKLARFAETFGSQDAGDTLRDKMFRRGRQVTTTQTGMPDETAVSNYDKGRTDVAPTAPTATSTGPASYDAQKGTVALQRLLALAADPGKYDDFAKGERQVNLNDFGGAAAADSLKDGGDIREAGEAFNQVSHPNINLASNDLKAQALDEAARKREAINSKGDADRASRELLAAEKALAQARRAQGAALLPADKQAAGKAVEEAAARVRELRGVAPAPGPAIAAPTAPAAAPAAFPYTPRRPAAAAAAYRAGG